MSSAGFLIIIAAFAFLYFIIVRPQKRRQLEAQRMASTLGVGDQVVTAGGIYGDVTELLDEDVMVEIAPDLRVRVARRAIGGVIHRADEPETPDIPTSVEDPG